MACRRGIAVLHLSMSVKEPPYTLEIHEGAFELRRYAPRVIAETRVAGTFGAASVGSLGTSSVATAERGSSR